jgi:hypothetical protein
MVVLLPCSDLVLDSKVRQKQNCISGFFSNYHADFRDRLLYLVKFQQYDAVGARYERGMDEVV